MVGQGEGGIQRITVADQLFPLQKRKLRVTNSGNGQTEIVGFAVQKPAATVDWHIHLMIRSFRLPIGVLEDLPYSSESAKTIRTMILEGRKRTGERQPAGKPIRPFSLQRSGTIDATERCAFVPGNRVS